MLKEDKFEYGVVTISTDNTVQIIGHHDYHLTLDNLYEYAKCDTIQIVHFSPDLLMCVDDNGKLLQKPINLIATLLFGQYPHDFIVGDVCIGTSMSPFIDDEPDIFAMPYKAAEGLAELLHSFKF